MPAWFQPPAKGGFKTVELNPMGWFALLGGGFIAGLAVTSLTSTPRLLGALVGSLAAWTVAVIFDHLRHGESRIHYHIDVAHMGELDQIIARLRKEGIGGEAESWVDKHGDQHFLLVVKQRDRSEVEKLIGWIE